MEMETRKRINNPWLFDQPTATIRSAKTNYPVAFMNIMDVTHKANAAYIVEACNNYERVKAERDELAAALKTLVDYMPEIWRNDEQAWPVGLMNRVSKLIEIKYEK